MGRRGEGGADHRFAFGNGPRVAAAARHVYRAAEDDEVVGVSERTLHHVQMATMEWLEATNIDECVVVGHGLWSVGEEDGIV